MLGLSDRNYRRDRTGRPELEQVEKEEKEGEEAPGGRGSVERSFPSFFPSRPAFRLLCHLRFFFPCHLCFFTSSHFDSAFFSGRFVFTLGRHYYCRIIWHNCHAALRDSHRCTPRKYAAIRRALPRRTHQQVRRLPLYHKVAENGGRGTVCTRTAATAPSALEK